MEKAESRRKRFLPARCFSRKDHKIFLVNRNRTKNIEQFISKRLAFKTIGFPRFGSKLQSCLISSKPQLTHLSKVQNTNVSFVPCLFRIGIDSAAPNRGGSLGEISIHESLSGSQRTYQNLLKKRRVLLPKSGSRRRKNNIPYQR